MANPSLIEIVLTEEQSELINLTGNCFIVLHKAMRTEQPAINGRMILTLAPCDINSANAAAGVIVGTHRATRIRNPS
jgi:hypothetical protein